MVRSDDNDSAGEHFEMDPLELLGDLPHPFCWVGLNPTLFDAPSRYSGADMTWLAHSFLSLPRAVADRREAHAILGFSWGFIRRASQITLVEPQALDGSVWNTHLPTLRSMYPTWQFATDFSDRD